MIPVIALVGRPNVGKSTLFNRLTCARDALIADFPELTCDRKYSRAEIEGREFICIDTGGIGGAEKDMETRTAEQSLLAIEEADVALFMVDARTDLMPVGIAIAKHLHSYEKPTFLVANKIGDIDVDQAMADFWSLGLGDTYPITVSYGRDVTSLLGQALLPWADEVSPQEEVDEDAEYWAKFEAKQNGEAEEESEDDFNPQDLPIKLAIVGHPNAGKSTLTNRILGENRVVVYGMPDTTRDSIRISMQHNKREYVLIDTARVRKRGKITDVVEKFSVIKTLQMIEDASATLLMASTREGISNRDLSLLGFIPNSGCLLATVVSKWDDLSREVKEQVKEILNYRLGSTDFVRVYFISALHDSGIGNLPESIRETYDSATCRVSTAMLTRIVNMTTEDYQPPLVRGHRVKLGYTHAGGYNPPIVVIHDNQVKDLPGSYRRYLVNYFHKSLDVMGIPIRIQFREGENPFVNKHNTLTPNQMRERKRSIRHVRRNG